MREVLIKTEITGDGLRNGEVRFEFMSKNNAIFSFPENSRPKNPLFASIFTTPAYLKQALRELCQDPPRIAFLRIRQPTKLLDVLSSP
jgi:hypothetical protein